MKLKNNNLWRGFIPPQYLYSNREFKGIAVNPPNFKPGSWTGAGKVIFNPESENFILTARPRKAEGGVRGFAVEIYHSGDGENFELLKSLSKNEVGNKSGMDIKSIEGSQILKDPVTGNWHLYLSVDSDSEFVWGGLYWQTLLLTAPDLNGPWESKGLVLENDKPYDAKHARDATIDIIDGIWYCIYKARDEDRYLRPALATSSDGINWEKQGTLTVDGKEKFIFLSGTIFAGTGAPLFIGLERIEEDPFGYDNMNYEDDYHVGHGGKPPRNFVALKMDPDNMNLKTVFRKTWEPLSSYEYKEQPLLGYSSIVYDPLQNRVLTYVEALDPEYTEKLGLNDTVERLLVYATRL